MAFSFTGCGEAGHRRAHQQEQRARHRKIYHLFRRRGRDAGAAEQQQRGACVQAAHGRAEQRQPDVEMKRI
jgi:hypothetical protein